MIKRRMLKMLVNDLRAWGKNTQAIAKGSHVPIARLDQSCGQSGLESLYFGSGGPEDFSCSRKADLKMLRQEMVSTGHLRNSFYPQIFKNHTEVDNIHLSLKLSGSFYCSVTQTRLNFPPEQISETVIEPLVRNDKQEGGVTETKIPLTLGTDVPSNSRLFWTLRALSDGATIHDAVWMATAPQETHGRMVVVLRTYGRTADVKKLLMAFEEQSCYSPHYARILNNIFFYVLDTSEDISAADYIEIRSLKNISAHVVKGANLGGGGNMSQALLYLDEAIEVAQIEIGDLLLLDDDLRLSLESLCRHWGSTLFRSDDTIFTLPVFMKSEPRRMWEDGGIWGRFLDGDMSGDRSSLAPRLLRHRKQFDVYEHLDEIARPHYPEYCTFIFFSLSHKRFKALGYPAAFFLRGDDIEYSLRHRKKGSKIFSNPNLCAWHEPAHSYGQEYMSIAHGVLINMRYGNKEVDAFIKFFHLRLISHAGIGDAFGLKVYAEVLRDINSRSVFLQNNFSAHYQEKLGMFKVFDQNFEYLSDELRDDLRRSAQHHNLPLGEYPFLYPQMKGEPELSKVILENPHTGLFRIYNPQDPNVLATCAKAVADFSAEMTIFIENFDALRNHYMKRFDDAEGQTFWDEELTHHREAEVLLALINE